MDLQRLPDFYREVKGKMSKWNMRQKVCQETKVSFAPQELLVLGEIMGVVGEKEVTSRMLSPSEKRLVLGSHLFCVVSSLPSGPQPQLPSKFPPGKMDGQSFRFTVMEVKHRKRHLLSLCYP